MDIERIVRQLQLHVRDRAPQIVSKAQEVFRLSSTAKFSGSAVASRPVACVQIACDILDEPIDKSAATRISGSSSKIYNRLIARIRDLVGASRTLRLSDLCVRYNAPHLLERANEILQFLNQSSTGPAAPSTSEDTPAPAAVGSYSEESSAVTSSRVAASFLAACRFPGPDHQPVSVSRWSVERICDVDRRVFGSTLDAAFSVADHLDQMARLAAAGTSAPTATPAPDAGSGDLAAGGAPARAPASAPAPEPASRADMRERELAAQLRMDVGLTPAPSNTALSAKGPSEAGAPGSGPTDDPTTAGMLASLTGAGVPLAARTAAALAAEQERLRSLVATQLAPPPARRGRGRPPGSLNKKQLAARTAAALAAEQERLRSLVATQLAPPPARRGRGRPPGSLNKKPSLRLQQQQQQERAIRSGAALAAALMANLPDGWYIRSTLPRRRPLGAPAPPADPLNGRIERAYLAWYASVVHGPPADLDDPAGTHASPKPELPGPTLEAIPPGR
ncbi:hypothetical protein H696_02913 [Fonticula alba]|uniref:ORC6 first cyclin-like domain-containing protein n=1 Tax=Fonticula alba TaxID=691883 RepID=A0A058Z9I6_FONAL|nr:hypothetical protein H696_02913 [Fonticula alba]KCV70568.1 hypothetical protein H696_02913 [Fonticula alba]|eukprot:XP_009495084.1 hypothetical protein H696_02913 [Fonticula alba]